MATAGRKALVKVSGVAVAFTNEATTGNAGRTVYTISNAAKAIWGLTVTITVENDAAGNAIYAASTGYTINRLLGQVTFATAKAAGTNVRVSGSYLPVSTAAEAKAYNYSLMTQNIPDNEFGDTQVTRVAAQKDASGSLGQWWSTDTYFSDALTAGNPVVLEFYSDSTGALDVRMWALLNKVGIQAVVDGLVEQSVEFQGTTDADKRTISG